jgi:hypothetical protein
LQNKKKETSAMPTWAFPFFGVVAMFSFVAFFAARARRNRSTRQFRLVQPDVEASQLSSSDDEVLQ